MLSEADILAAMLFELAIPDPLHAGGAPKVFTFQFAGAGQPGDLWVGYSGWAALAEAAKAAIRAALAHVETLVSIDFVEVTGAADPDFNFGAVALPGATAGWGGYRYSWSGTGLVAWDGYAVFDRTLDLARAPGLILHEIGHALGLRHPFEGPAPLPDARDSSKYTVMSYTANPDTGKDSDAMQLFDILALQDRWGANRGHAAGNDTYAGPRNATVDCIWDAGGIDTLSAAGRSGAVQLDLREGHFSRFGTRPDVSIAFGTVIENATGGAGADRITGSGGANLLRGNAGNDRLLGLGGPDRLEGGPGADRLEGGPGNDVLAGGGGRDRFVFAAGGGRDILRDFQDGIDTILFRGFGPLAEVTATARERDGDVLFILAEGADRLRVLDTTLAALAGDLALA